MGKDLPAKVSVWGERVGRVPDGRSWPYMFFDVTKGVKYQKSSFGVRMYEMYERYKQIDEENAANILTGVVEGSNAWTITNLPLTANRTNVVVVTGTTTSWAPACGGNTTFNQTLMVVCYPIQATLGLEGTGALLDWTGGGPPYRVQRASNLPAGNWSDFLTNAVPPVAVPLDGATGFYRITGQ